MRSFVVYQTDTGKLGYRSLSSELGHTYTENEGNMLMTAMTGFESVVQTWMIDAKDGNDAIRKVRLIIKAKGLK